MPREVNIFDEGIVLSDAMRVASGEVVHRDFYSNYGPAQYYIVAALLRLTDGSFLATRLYDIACKAIVCGQLFYVARAVVGRVFALLVAAVAGLWFLAFAGAALYPIYPCMILGLVATYLMVSISLQRSNLWSALVAGICAGATALFRYEVGFFLLAANLLGTAILIWQSREAEGFRRLAGVVIAYGIGTAIVFVPAATAFLLVAPVVGFWHDIIVASTTYYSATRGLPFPKPWSFPDAGGVYFGPLIAILGLVEAARISWSGSQKRPNGDDIPARAFLILFSLCTLFFVIKGIVRVSSLHMLLANVPAFIIVAILAQRWLSRGPRMAQAAAILVLLLAVGSPIRLAGGQLRNDVRNPGQVFAGLILERAGYGQEGTCRTTRRSGVATYRSDYIRVINYIASRTRSDERIFVALDRHDKIFINPVALYFATWRLPGTHWHQFDPGLQTRADTQAAMVADLQANRVRWIIRDGSIENPNEPNGSSKSSGVTLLDEYIDSVYRKVALSGQVSVWLLKSEVPTPIDPLAICEAKDSSN